MGGLWSLPCQHSINKVDGVGSGLIFFAGSVYSVMVISAALLGLKAKFSIGDTRLDALCSFIKVILPQECNEFPSSYNMCMSNVGIDKLTNLS